MDSRSVAWICMNCRISIIFERYLSNPNMSKGHCVCRKDFRVSLLLSILSHANDRKPVSRQASDHAMRAWSARLTNQRSPNRCCDSQRVWLSVARSQWAIVRCVARRAINRATKNGLRRACSARSLSRALKSNPCIWILLTHSVQGC